MVDKHLHVNEDRQSVPILIYRDNLFCGTPPVSSKCALAEPAATGRVMSYVSRTIVITNAARIGFESDSGLTL